MRHKAVSSDLCKWIPTLSHEEFPISVEKYNKYEEHFSNSEVAECMEKWGMPCRDNWQVKINKTGLQRVSANLIEKYVTFTLSHSVESPSGKKEWWKYKTYTMSLEQFEVGTCLERMNVPVAFEEIYYVCLKKKMGPAWWLYDKFVCTCFYYGENNIKGHYIQVGRELGCQINKRGVD